MFPPKGPGDRAVIASRSGATASVPMKGCHGRERPRSSLTSSPSRRRQTQTFSASDGCSVRVSVVDVSPPKNGIRQLTAKSRVGSMSSMLTASTSPGSAPST